MRRNIHNMHNTRRAIVLLLFMVMSLTMKAQVFMIDGDDNYREPENPQVFAGLPENYGLGVDYFVPIGDGLLLFTALGGAYLVGKRKKQTSVEMHKNN